MHRIYRFILVAFVLVACVGCDQASKTIARGSLASSQPLSLLNDSVQFEYSENTGAFLSLGSNLPGEVRFLLLVVFVGAILAITLTYTITARRLDLMQLIGLSFLTGGGLGNLLDRISNDGTMEEGRTLCSNPGCPSAVSTSLPNSIG